MMVVETSRRPNADSGGAAAVGVMVVLQVCSVGSDSCSVLRGDLRFRFGAAGLSYGLFRVSAQIGFGLGRLVNFRSGSD
ncbi:hypothetical protein Hanom_Chr10g00909101 [Helianthus anomalus]